jgi:integrating conjugative element protein (TIGR03755 family)
MLTFKKSILVLIVIFPVLSHASLIPTGNNPFYYRLGGGLDIPKPANQSTTTIPLHVDSNVGLGYNCGVFDPNLSITNSLNDIAGSFQNVEEGVVQNATSAIAEFPLYAIARADPNLYNLLNNALLGARKDFELSTKSCEVMQSEIGRGQNPYTDWGSLSMGNDWKYHMSLANNQNLSLVSDTNLSGSDFNTVNGDINQVSKEVAKDNGANGVPWIHGINAGGVGQPVILVIHDTAVAGYNVILQSSRAYDDVSVPPQTNANDHLTSTWTNPALAANWIVNVLGDEEITTFANGAKESTPGMGLLPANQKLTASISEKLQNLISGQTPVTIENLKAVSAPGVMINAAVISAIKQKEPVTQAIIVNKLAQEIATAKIIDKALLAREILEEGSQVPAIYINTAAQHLIHQAISRLDDAMNNLLFNVKVRKELVSNTVTQLLENTQGEAISDSLIQSSSKTKSILQNGAVKK